MPGPFRKVGPSLRHIASKVDADWLYRWIRRPADFRPTTRMPQFFLHYQHLDGNSNDFTLHTPDDKAVAVSDVEYTQRFENIEIRALTKFLLSRSQPFTYIQPPSGITEPPSAERGKLLFETRGCLACHSHDDFRRMEQVRQNKLTQGPDLSRIGAKLNTPRGQSWLYSWLKQPNHYYARTAMPNLLLDPIVEKDASGNPTGKTTDPAADIAIYLLNHAAEWQPEVPPPAAELSPQEARDLEDLAANWLTPSFQSKQRAAEYATTAFRSELRRRSRWTNRCWWE